MVLYPLTHSSPENQIMHAGGVPRRQGSGVATLVSAWEAVERKQKQSAEAWWLVAQPDHAALAGDLAAAISCSFFPRLAPDVVEAITLHDAGWAQFDGGGREPRPPASGARHAKNQREPETAKASRRPLSFLDMRPVDFIRAWSDSIQRAEESSAIGGLLVSHHFCRLAENRLRSGGDAGEDRNRLESFVATEVERKRSLEAKTKYSEQEICVLVDVLQFCDLLSLYLCSGAEQDVEFPQKFQGRGVVLRREGEMCAMEPAIFGGGVSLGVSARRYPSAEAEPVPTTLAFLLG